MTQANGKISHVDELEELILLKYPGTGGREGIHTHTHTHTHVITTDSHSFTAETNTKL